MVVVVDIMVIIIMLWILQVWRRLLLLNQCNVVSVKWWMGWSWEAEKWGRGWVRWERWEVVGIYPWFEIGTERCPRAMVTITNIVSRIMGGCGVDLMSGKLDLKCGGGGCWCWSWWCWFLKRIWLLFAIRFANSYESVISNSITPILSQHSQVERNDRLLK